MSDKAKSAVTLLTVVLLGMLLGCKPSQEKPSEPTTESSAQILGQTPEQKVLDRLLGNWSSETTTFKAKWTPQEKHTTGTYSFVRILGGAFVQGTGEDSEKNSILNLYTYDQQRRCYRTWSFGSNYGGPEVPANGKWNEVTQRIEYNETKDDAQTSAAQMHFVNEDTVVISGVIKDAAGEVLLNMEFKMTRLKGSADATKAQSVSAPSESHSDGEVRAMCQNNLKQLGLVFKMFANENKGMFFPELSPQAGHLFFANENGEDKKNVYPEYLTDLRVVVCPATIDSVSPSNRSALQDPKLLDDGSYFYLGYVVTSDTEVKAFAEAYKERIKKGLKFDQDLDGPQGGGNWEGNKFYRLHEGIERFGITDINDPASAAKVQSKIPILIERPGHHKPDGANILFMDGHVEFIRYPSAWPMTEATISVLTELSESKAAPAK